MAQQKTLLITGGLGFIGSSISERFLQLGWRVTIVDSLVSNVVDPEHFPARYSDVEVEKSACQDYFSRPDQHRRFDLVVHAASLVGPAGILAYAGTIGEEIVHSTYRIIEYCTNHHVPLVYFSSAEVYGHSGVLNESMDIRVPPTYNARLEYALGKLTCEAMLINSRSRGLRTVIIRPFNVVGPRQSRIGGFVMPTMVQQALAGQPLTVFESGQQRRAFTDVDDIVAFVENHAIRGFDSTHPIFNVGNPDNATTIEKLAQSIRQLLGATSELVFTSGSAVYGPLYCEAESFDKLPDITKAINLGWRPQTSLESIILKTAAFYRRHDDPREPSARRAAA
jgi:nucleoside-diphosphate-sugar epimerase